MPKEHINEQCDLKILPLNVTKNNQSVLGDLHAHSLKLVYALYRHGLLTNLTQEQYNKLWEIYEHSLAKADLNEFRQILKIPTYAKDGQITFLGDDVADRCKNDLFTIEIYGAMEENNVLFEILLSNHNLVFILLLEGKKTLETLMGSSNAHILHRSLIMLCLCLDDVISQKEFNDLIDRAYKPFLKVLSYGLNPERNAITLLTHALVGFDIVKALAKKLGVRYEDSTAVELAKTIERINALFQVKVQAGEVNTLFTEEALDSIADQKGQFSPSNYPFEHITWNRIVPLYRPHKINDYKVYYVRGHDPAEEKLAHCTNLDNTLGKEIERTIGAYTAISSDNGSLSKKEIEALKPEIEICKLLAQLPKISDRSYTLHYKREATIITQAHTILYQATIDFFRGSLSYEDYYQTCKTQEEPLSFLSTDNALDICKAIMGHILELKSNLTAPAIGRDQFFKVDSKNGSASIKNHSKKF